MIGEDWGNAQCLWWEGERGEFIMVILGIFSNTGSIYSAGLCHTIPASAGGVAADLWVRIFVLRWLMMAAMSAAL